MRNWSFLIATNAEATTTARRMPQMAVVALLWAGFFINLSQNLL